MKTWGPNKHSKSILYIALGGLLTLANQNCTPDPEHSELLSSESCGQVSDLISSCEQERLKSFKETFYPFLENKCATCHSNGPGIGRFASDDIASAWNGFESIGKAKIISQALNPNHQPGYTGPDNQLSVSQADEAYSLHEEKFNLCERNSLASCESPTKSYGLESKSRGLISSEVWTRLTFEYPGDFKTEIPELDGKLQAFSVEYRLYKIQDSFVGYQLRDPRLEVNEDIKIQGIRASYNWAIDPYLTTYLNLNGYVSQNDDRLIETAGETYGILFDSDFNSSNLNYLGFVLDGIQFKSKAHEDSDEDDNDDTPIEEIPSTTYPELTAPEGIFYKHCLECHSSAGGRRPFITDSTLPSLISAGYIVPGDSLRSVIYQRMTDAVSPMPQAGLLPSLQRKTIKKWIDEGAPAN